MCIFCYSYNYIKICINFKWTSDKNVKYINFKYIILAPPEISFKIRHSPLYTVDGRIY